MSISLRWLTYAVRLRGRPGTKQLRDALSWADENTWSPQEVILRLYWRDAQPRRRVHCNRPIFDRDGRHLITPDLLDVEHGVAGEYDGVVHLERGAFRRDLNRDALYRDLGIEVVTMMSADARDVTDFLARLRGAYRRADGTGRRRQGLDRCAAGLVGGHLDGRRPPLAGRRAARGLAAQAGLLTRRT